MVFDLQGIPFACREEALSHKKLGGGVKCFIIFIPIWGRFPFWLIFFKGVETTNQKTLVRFREKIPKIAAAFSWGSSISFHGIWCVLEKKAGGHLFLEPQAANHFFNGWKWWFPTIFYMKNIKIWFIIPLKQPFINGCLGFQVWMSVWNRSVESHFLPEGWKSSRGNGT